jgi:3-oxoacyl-[acyl-carrier-protein] synthase II
VATAWFPAALQGQVSLAHQYKGYSKTFSAGGVAGLQALGYAYEGIKGGRADVILCGAAEDLSSKYVQAILTKYQEQTGASSPVFGRDGSSTFAEGAAFLVFEEYEHALRRGAKVLCEVTGFADNFCPTPETAVGVVQKNMEKAVTPANDTLFVMDGGMSREEELTRAAMSGWQNAVDLASTREQLGNMFALSGVVEAVCAAGALSEGSLSGRSVGVANAERAYQRVGIRRLSARGAVTTVGLSRAA